MDTFIILSIVAAIVFLFYKMLSNSKVVANEDGFSQAGVKVNYKTGKITIKGKTYDVNAVQGITHEKVSRLGTEVRIRVDDFNKPVHKIGVTGFDDEGEKFVQRLYTALRKAGGPDFY